MAASSKIRVGIVGASANRGFASIAHIPALRALPQFEIAAVCTARQESAEVAARHYGVALAFSDPEQLARHPDVDLVRVCGRLRPRCCADLRTEQAMGIAPSTIRRDANSRSEGSPEAARR
jgi:hypothetical protein